MKKPTIMILGVHHFSDQENGDLFRIAQDSMLSENRQTEIKEIVASLKSFNPTKIAVEVEHKHHKALNDRYISFLNENDSLTINEVHQIGFRLAKACQLQDVHAVDWNEEVEGVPDLSLLKSSEDSDAFEVFLSETEKMMNEANTYLHEQSLKEFMLWQNEPDNIRKWHQVYMKLALIGNGDHPHGARWTAQYWYYRNLLIYKNLVGLIESEDDRIFVLYGTGHLHLLLQFLEESGLVEIERVENVLA